MRQHTTKELSEENTTVRTQVGGTQRALESARKKGKKGDVKKQEKKLKQQTKEKRRQWGLRTPDGTITPLANTDGSFGRLVGRSKVVTMSVETFAFLCGDIRTGFR